VGFRPTIFLHFIKGESKGSPFFVFNKYFKNGIKMKHFKEFIIEEKDNSKSLHCYDLDDTLVTHDHSKSRVHVLDPHGNRVRTLTSSEYNTHTLPKDHKYDYSEFKSSDVFGKSAKPIKKMIHRLKATQKSGAKTEILTARADLDDKDKFAHHMKKFGIDIDKVHVRRAGNVQGKPADAKAAVLHDLITKHGYKDVHLYDDSKENLDKFLKLKSKHKEVSFNAHHVEHDPSSGDVNITTRKV
jgi:hypothetical protein